MIDVDGGARNDRYYANDPYVGESSHVLTFPQLENIIQLIQVLELSYRPPRRRGHRASQQWKNDKLG